MRLSVRIAAVASLLFVLATGCEYGPEHLPVLRANRETHLREARKWDTVIVDVEGRHGLARSPGIPDAQAAEVAQLEADKASLEDRAAALEVEASALRAANRKLAAELGELEDPWFRSLPSGEQVEWRIHRDLLRERADASGRALPDAGPPREGETTGPEVEAGSDEAEAGEGEI